MSSQAPWLTSDMISEAYARQLGGERDALKKVIEENRPKEQKVTVKRSHFYFVPKGGAAADFDK